MIPTPGTDLVSVVDDRIKFLRDLVTFSGAQPLYRTVYQRDIELFEECRDALSRSTEHQNGRPQDNVEAK